MTKRRLGVDLGTKRIGLAVTDPLNILSTAWKTIYFKSSEQLAEEINNAIKEKDIGIIVFGLPMTLGNKESKKTKETKVLVNYLRTKIDESVIFEYEDEALTSQEAVKILREMGKNPQNNRDLIDQIAAQRILQAYQDRF